MGSDLSMNPPESDRFRAEWRGDVLVVERWRDGIYGKASGGGVWTVVVEAPLSQGHLDLINWWTNATGGFQPPEKPSAF